MKKKIIFMGIIFFMMLVIPFFTIENKNNFTYSKDYISKNNLKKLIYNEFRTEYETETLKVLSIILQTNYNSGNLKAEFMSKEEFFAKYPEKGDEYNQKIENAIDETHKKIILHKNKTTAIPYSYVVNGEISQEKIIDAVATPWDCLENEYKSTESKGISLNTANILCKEGFTYVQALNYFLNNIEIALL